MCTEDQHKIISLLADIKKMSEVRPDRDSTVGISSTQPLVLDYRQRRHVYVWSPVSMALTVEDVGTTFLPSNSWKRLDFQEGMKLTPVAVTSLVTVLVRATDSKLDFVTPPGVTPYTITGQSFIGSQFLNVASGTYPLSLFNSSSKTFLVYAIHGSASSGPVNGNVLYVQPTTTDPAYNTVITPVNAKFGSTASVASLTANSTTSGPNTPYIQAESGTGIIDILTQGAVIYLTKGNGIAAYMQTYASGFVNVVLKWLEI